MDASADPNNSNVLPSQIFTTVAALLPAVDRRAVVVLHDGRKLFGVVRSFDQFANLVIQDTTERIYINQQTFGETYRGVLIVRGENVVYVGEIDEHLEEQEEAIIVDSTIEESNIVPFPKISPGALLADRQQQKYKQQQDMERNPETGLPILRRIPFEDAEKIYDEIMKSSLEAHVKQQATLPNEKFDDAPPFIRY